VRGFGLRGALKSAVPSVIALLLGIAAASILMTVLGLNPVSVFTTLFKGALYTSFGQSSVLTYMGSYILLGLAFLIPGRAGIWNVGGQGQAVLGGITATTVIVFVQLPPILWPLFAIIAAIFAGAAWSAISGLLEAYRNASAIVTTIMLNFVAASFASYLFYEVIVTKAPNVSVTESIEFSSTATIPTFPYFNTSIMFVIAILLAGGTAWFLGRTTLGYSIRATGLGSRPAESKGINPRTTRVIAMALGGALAGLAGAGDVLSVGHGCYLTACYQDGFISGWFGGEGFAGIAVALMAANNPIGAIFSGAFLAILASGMASVLQDVYIVWAMQGIIIAFVAAPQLSRWILQIRGKKSWT
jgi:general nucleoside transport system permease protein